MRGSCHSFARDPAPLSRPCVLCSPPRPPAGLRVRWLEARRRHGHSPLPAGAATLPPGRAPRSLAAVQPGAGRTAPPETRTKSERSSFQFIYSCGEPPQIL
eukprot:XP_017452295.1 PREDICTED: uncharacterized protein LOC103690550 isoform X2 [Rattus norvegicus]